MVKGVIDPMATRFFKSCMHLRESELLQFVLRCVHSKGLIFKLHVFLHTFLLLTHVENPRRARKMVPRMPKRSPPKMARRARQPVKVLL